MSNMNKDILEKQKNNELSFEDAMKRIEAIMAELEGGKLPLDASVELYGESMALIAYCNKKLDMAREKIKVVTPDGEKDIQE